MQSSFDIDHVVRAIETLFKFALIEENKDAFAFKLFGDKTATLNKMEVEKILLEINQRPSDSNLEIFEPNIYEVLVVKQSEGYFEKQVVQTDLVNKLDYQVSKPSNRYLVMLICYLNKYDSSVLSGAIWDFRLRSIKEKSQDVLDVIRHVVPGLTSLTIKAGEPTLREDFESVMFAFIFNVAYNSDYIIMPVRTVDEFIQANNDFRLRGRPPVSEVEAPKRLYSNDLVIFYQKGASSESIDLKFLSFYHVPEHFFEKVYNDEIINTVKTELTRPDFSYKRTKDIQALIKIIQKRLRYKNEEFLINEPEALRLTIEKFIPDPNVIKQELDRISPDLVKYFAVAEVPFCDGPKVNFNSVNAGEIFSNLSKRISRTRNAIVHSKETDKSRYMPFKDEKDLVNEVLLIRIIAERIIIGDSKEL